jgi:hypothetical protein
MADETGSGENTGQPAGDPQGDNGQTTSGSLLNAASTQQEASQETGQAQTASTETTTPEFLAHIQDETIKTDPSLRDIKSVEDLAKSYVHAQKLVGKDRLAVPTDENDTAAWNDVLSKLGRPENAQGYELPKPAEDSPAQLPEGMDQKFAEKAHELGLTNKQARDLFGWYIQDVAEAEVASRGEKFEQERKQAETTLRQEFGNAFDDRLQDANRALNEYGDQNGELRQLFDNTGLGNDPNVIRFLAKIGEGLREDTVGGSTKPVGRSPDQAHQEIGTLKSDQAFMKTYLDPTQSGHREAVDRMRRLYEDAYPN